MAGFSSCFAFLNLGFLDYCHGRDFIHSLRLSQCAHERVYIGSLLTHGWSGSLQASCIQCRLNSFFLPELLVSTIFISLRPSLPFFILITAHRLLNRQISWFTVTEWSSLQFTLVSYSATLWDYSASSGWNHCNWISRSELTHFSCWLNKMLTSSGPDFPSKWLSGLHYTATEKAHSKLGLLLQGFRLVLNLQFEHFHFWEEHCGSCLHSGSITPTPIIYQRNK